ncbi:bile acid:sodium symporter [Caulobacter sp. 17J80-11]|uniref:bile acid:sodium symporter n=1 Tax=Caulobacter sp. 17J80-11 TaxID=2763502 RepID=UPI001653AF09|nr:bile acid:sodium symporter [Caulobacter sp. 17J80-11]MBC6981341.1 bile acid:sodium symporter [Caulobacter sp. 17J80-11]
MTLAELIPLLMKASVAAMVIAMGLQADRGELTWLLRQPGLLARSLVSMILIAPVLATGAALVFRLTHMAEVMLVALSLAPVPPLLPRKQKKAEGREAYALSLLVCAAVASIVSIPIWVEVVERVAGVPLRMTAAAVAKIVLVTVLAPLAVGALVRVLAPRFAAELARPLSTLALAALALGLLAVLAKAWPAIMAQVGDGTLLAIVAFVALSLAVGWALGGPEPSDRTVLALSTATRHPGVALAIVSANYPGEKGAAATLLLFLLVGGVVSGVWLAVRKRRAKG